MKTVLGIRLWKEARALSPAWGVTIVAMLVSRMVLGRQNGLEAWLAYALGAQLVSAVTFGHEFNDKTIGTLLTQPLSRFRIWREKMAVLAVALAGLLVCMAAIAFCDFRGIRSFNLEGSDLAALMFLLPIVIGWCSGPLMTLLMRSTIGGTALMTLLPWALALPLLLAQDYSEVSHRWLFGYTLISQSTYCLVCAVLGYKAFCSFEQKGSVSTEFTAPSLGALTDRLAFGTGSVANLAKKEFRLQQPAFILAAVLVIFWLALIGIKLLRPTLPVECLAIPAAILVLATPAMAGIVTVAEERHLELHDWHLTLPLSSHRQWMIKTFVGFAINLGLGIGLGGVIVQIVQSAFHTTLIGKTDSFGWLMLNVSIYSISVYASSFSSNGLRAFSAAALIACALVIGWGLLIPPRWGAPSARQFALFWISSVCFFWAMGLCNFRRTLTPIPMLARQALWFCAMFLAVLNLLIVLRQHGFGSGWPHRF